MNKQKTFTVFLSFLFCLLLCGQAVPRSKTSPPLPNFHNVSEGIYRGGAPTREGLKSLKTRNIRWIIDLRGYSKKAKAEQKYAEEIGFKWINIPMGREAPTKKQVETFLNTLAKAPDEPVFVHCQYGADRTGAMIGIYRVQVQQMSFKDAWNEMRRFGFKPYPKELKNAVQSRSKS